MTRPTVPTEQAVREALRDVVDPELGLNVVDLGLIYRVEAAAGRVRVDMTMTTRACPMGSMIVEQARDRIRALAPSAEVDVNLVWDPPWSPARLSEDARRFLGWEGPGKG